MKYLCCFISLFWAISCSSKNQDIHLFKEEYANKILTDAINKKDISSYLEKLTKSQLNVRDTSGNSLLGWIVSRCEWKYVELFLKSGANPNLPSLKYKQTPFQDFLMRSRKFRDSYEEKVRLWKECGTNFNYFREFQVSNELVRHPISTSFNGEPFQLTILIKYGLNPFETNSVTKLNLYSLCLNLDPDCALELIRNKDIPLLDSVTIMNSGIFKNVSTSGYLSLETFLIQKSEILKHTTYYKTYQEMLVELRRRKEE